jgi:peptide/nickel transport system substrate-binding protein
MRISGSRRRVAVSRTLVAVSIIILVVVAAAAYEFLMAPKSGGAPSAGGKILVAVRNSQTSDMDPRETSSIDVVQNVYDKLTLVEPNQTAVPQLATSWSSSANDTKWVFKLRQGVTFHDGTPFNSSAVVFSILGTAKLGQGDAPDTWNGLQNVVALDTYTVEIDWAFPANVPDIVGAGYSAFIFSPHIWAYSGVPKGNDTALATWFDQFHDDGSGPYVLLANESAFATGITLAAYSKYWGGWQPNQFREVFIKFISQTGTAVQYLESGQVNMTGLNGQFQYLPELKSHGITVSPAASFATIWLLLNTRHHLLNNPVVRRALLTAIDYGQVLNQSFYGYGSLFSGGVNPGKFAYTGTVPAYPPKGDIAAAKAILRSGGITGGLNASWLITYSTGSPFLSIAAQVLQTNWAPLGVTLSIQGTDFGSLSQEAGYYNSTTKTVFAPGPLSYANSSQAQDMVLLNWVGTTNDPWLVIDELFAIQPAPYQNDILYNWTYWTNSTFTNLLNQAHIDEAVNQNRSIQEFQTVNKMIYQSGPGWPLYAEETVTALGPHVKGYVPNPNYGFAYPYWYQMYYG